MKKNVIRFLGFAAAAVLMMGCSHPIGGDHDTGNKNGSLTLTISDGVSRSILPALSMTPASYLVEGTGPNGTTYSETTTLTASTIDNLAIGQWSVTVTALNAEGTAIGAGSGTVTIVSNASVNLNITVTPYDGFGSLSLTVSWPVSSLQTPSIQATLLPTVGTERTLNFTVNAAAGTATFTAADIPTGYHTLTIKLLENGTEAIGGVEVVRIVKDQTTTGTISFANVSPATGTLSVHIDADICDVLPVSVSGAASTKAHDETLNLSASVVNYTGNVTYIWYVNGDAIQTGNAFTIDSSWAQGWYRIDVTAFSADGKRAGSLPTLLQVIE